MLTLTQCNTVYTSPTRIQSRNTLLGRSSLEAQHYPEESSERLLTHSLLTRPSILCSALMELQDIAGVEPSA